MNIMGAHKSQSKKMNVLKLEPGKNQHTDDHIKEIASLRTELTHLSKRLTDVEALVQAADPAKISETAKQLREELITGLKALGERVSKAIQEMDKRFETFREEVNEKSMNPAELSSASDDKTISETENEADSDKMIPFGDLREPELLSEGQYEVISKGNIAQLAELFRKQSEAIRRISELHQQKFTFFEHQMDAHEKIVDDRVKRAEHKIRYIIGGVVAGFLVLVVWILFTHYL